jgi:predicted nucleic-acid-binding Zn-ribbon protein
MSIDDQLAQRFVCTNCGYTEMYNPKIFEQTSHAANVLDVLFGG